MNAKILSHHHHSDSVQSTPVMAAYFFEYEYSCFRHALHIVGETSGSQSHPICFDVALAFAASSSPFAHTQAHKALQRRFASEPQAVVAELRQQRQAVEERRAQRQVRACVCALWGQFSFFVGVL